MTAVVTSPGASNVDVEDMALDLVRDRLAGLGRQYTPVDVATAMRAEGLVVSDSAVLDTVESLRRHSVGAGPLEQLLHQPGVTDVLVNGADQVFVDRGAGLELTGVRFRCEGDVRRLAQRLAASVGRRLDDAMPFVDARLADGSRVHAVLGTAHVHLTAESHHVHWLSVRVSVDLMSTSWVAAVAADRARPSTLPVAPPPLSAQ